jgi:hypothetical protein
VINYFSRHATLRAIVDTGGKSFHAWFDIPAPPACPVSPPSLTSLSVEEKEMFRWASKHWTTNGTAARIMTDLTAKLKQIEKEDQPLQTAWYDANRHLLKRHEELVARHKLRVVELYEIAKGLGCDPKMFRFCPTARLPGCERHDEAGNPTERWQRLVFFDPKCRPQS